jgi:hypothetical protein
VTLTAEIQRILFLRTRGERERREGERERGEERGDSIGEERGR